MNMKIDIDAGEGEGEGSFVLYASDIISTSLLMLALFVKFIEL